jgi:hypothetical protein
MGTVARTVTHRYEQDSVNSIRVIKSGCNVRTPDQWEGTYKQPATQGGSQIAYKFLIFSSFVECSRAFYF